MESATIIREFQIHVVVELAEGQPPNIMEMFCKQILGEIGKQGVDSYQINSEGFSAGDEVHFFDPAVKEHWKLQSLLLMQGCQYFAYKELGVSNYYSIDICNHRIEETGAGWHRLLCLILNEIA